MAGPEVARLAVASNGGQSMTTRCTGDWVTCEVHGPRPLDDPRTKHQNHNHQRTTTMSRAETYRYVLNTRDETFKIKAAHYVHEDEFTIFKDEEGGIVASFCNNEIVGIVRETTSSASLGPNPETRSDIIEQAKALLVKLDEDRHSLPDGI